MFRYNSDRRRMQTGRNRQQFPPATHEPRWGIEARLEYLEGGARGMSNRRTPICRPCRNNKLPATAEARASRLRRSMIPLPFDCAARTWRRMHETPPKYSPRHSQHGAHWKFVWEMQMTVCIPQRARCVPLVRLRRRPFFQGCCEQIRVRRLSLKLSCPIQVHDHT